MPPAKREVNRSRQKKIRCAESTFLGKKMQQEIRAKGVLNPRQEIGRSPWHHPPDFAAAGFERHEITGFPGPRGIFPGSPPGIKAMAGRPVAPGGAVTDEEPGCVTGMTLDPIQKICRQGKKHRVPRRVRARSGKARPRKSSCHSYHNMSQIPLGS